MLKIKDDVDLSILKRYGFEYDEWNKYYNFEFEELYVKKEDKVINSEYSLSEESLDTLYDMIQDEIVEKVVK